MEQSFEKVSELGRLKVVQRLRAKRYALWVHSSSFMVHGISMIQLLNGSMAIWLTIKPF